MTATTNSEVQPDDTPDGSTESERPTRWRQRTAVAVVVLASILAPIAVDAVWIKDTALNTDSFVEQLAPLSTDADVQEAMADAVSNEILKVVDLPQRLGEVLPEQLGFLAGPLDNTMKQFVQRTALSVVSSQQFSTLWEKALRRVHKNLIALLSGDTVKGVTVTNGVVTLDLTQIRDKVMSKLDKVGVGKFLKVDTAKPLEITLFQSENLAKAQTFVRLLRFFGWFAPVLVLLLYALSVALATERRRIALGIGVGLVIGMALHLTGLAIGESLYLEAVIQVLPHDAAKSVFNLLVKFPRTGTRGALVLGLVITLAAIAYGPGPKMTRMRHAISGLFGRAGTAGAEASVPVAAVGHFVRTYRTAFRVIVIIGGLLVLAAQDRLSGVNVLWTTVGVLVVLAIVEVFAAAGKVVPAVASANQDADHDPDEVPVG